MKDIYTSLIYCIMYAICSICFSLSAKNLFRAHNFQNIGILLLFESAVNVLICTIINIIQVCFKSINSQTKLGKKKEMKIILHNEKNGYQENLNKYAITFIFSCLYVANVLFGLKAFQFIPIPIFLTIRRTLIFFIYIINIVFYINSPSQITSIQKISIILITIGAIVAGCDNLNTNFLGLAYCILNNIFSASLLQLASYLKHKNNMTPFQLVYNNSLNTLPLLIIYCLITNDAQQFLSVWDSYSPSFFYHISLVAIFGFLLNYTTNLCTMKNSPFSIAITHNLKDIFSSMFSIIMFDDIIISVPLVAGYITSLAGSIIYTLQKVSERKTSISYYQKSFIYSLNTLVDETKYQNTQKLYLQKSISLDSYQIRDIEQNIKDYGPEKSLINKNLKSYPKSQSVIYSSKEISKVD